MTIQGPDYCKDNVDKAYSDIMEYLKIKFKIHEYPVEEKYEEIRVSDSLKLRGAIESLFLHNSWEMW